MAPVRFDTIGYWSEVKLDIVGKYAAAYSRILTANRFEHVYIDAFVGPGVHFSKQSGLPIQGSPANALEIDPPFREFFFIDINDDRVDYLKDHSKRHKDARVNFYQGDCNYVLLKEVFPTIRYEYYRRALCLLDPYGLHLDWKVIFAAGQTQTIEIFLNFPVMDMNRNVLWINPTGVSTTDIQRMNRFWGDSSWREQVYRPSRQQTLFDEPELEKSTNEQVADAFEDRLKRVAGFKHVLRLPMKNSRNAIVYYLFFASQKPAAEHIVQDIFSKYDT